MRKEKTKRNVLRFKRFPREKIKVYWICNKNV